MFSIFKCNKANIKNDKSSEIVDNPDRPNCIPSSSKNVIVTDETALKLPVIEADDLGDLETGPKHLKLSMYPKTQFGQQKRSFSSEYFKEYQWLEYSIKKDAAFCFPCRIFVGASVNEDTWTKNGFNNWQKLSERLKKHNIALSHITCVSKLSSFYSSKSKGSVVAQLSSAHNEQIRKNRLYISHLIDIVLFLAKQGVAFRGHYENDESINQGNFKELCKLYAKSVPDFENMYIKDTNYSSWRIQNELIDICASSIKEIILNEISTTGFFAIMCDEARTYKEEQLSLCVRYAVGLNVFERFLGFIDVSSGQNATQIYSAIMHYFEQQNINMEIVHIVAQSYDGASVMSGHLNGVQAQVQKQYPAAIYTHCMAHRLNLVVLDLCKSIKSAQKVFNILEATYVHFSRPSKNAELLDIQKQLGLKKGQVMRICDTRWICRYKNCEAIINNYKAIVAILQKEVEDQNDKHVAQAIGILNSIQNSDFVVVVFILYEVLSIINVLSQQLQSKSATLGKSVNVIKSVVLSFNDLRSDDAFSVFWIKLKDFCDNNDIVLTTPSTGGVQSQKRKRKESITLQDYALTTPTGATYSNSEDVSVSVDVYWRRTAYFRIIDDVISNLNKRFSDESLELATSIDHFFNLNINESLFFINRYKDVLGTSYKSLKAEMLVLKNCLSSNYLLEDVICVCNPEVYPNLYKLMQVALTIPISSATCERSFSSMRRIKNWLRTSMVQSRFSNLSSLYIERELTIGLKNEDIINNFAQKSRRLDLI